MAKNRGQRPAPRSSAELIRPPEQVDYDQQTPKFCLRHLHPDFDVRSLRDESKRADFAMALQIVRT
ncbi:MAG: hypothetical protein JO115_04140 [Pseudonocardiales bacterium]|nr:hypothetical protein [Pseudonocardiales bacterium]